ncbi:5137_t:CDS:1, partial [Entrophospora sp. SA101]
LNSCICLTNRCITEIARSCPELRHLELGNCSIGNKAVEEIARNCNNLKYLSLEGCNGISEEVMKKLNSKIKIEHPDYSNDEFSDSDLPPLVPDPLRVLDPPVKITLRDTITDLISVIRVSSELTDSERTNLLNSLARAINQ